MSIDEARKLHELIADNEELQAQFNGLELRGQVIDKLMEIAAAEQLKVNRKDVETLLCKLAEKTGEMDDDNLEIVAGGNSSDKKVCYNVQLLPVTNIK